jgi:surface polysaccharide O-acyltransferase-like enzyme
MLNPDNYFKTSLCGYSHLNVIIYSVCLYVFACFSWSRMQFSDKLTKIILNLGKASFGIYLSQEIFIKIIRHADLATKYITPWISIPILSVLVFISSYCVVLILSKIPYLKNTIS